MTTQYDSASADTAVSGPTSPALPGIPLSFGQEQLWFIDQLAPGEPTYTIHLSYRLRGRLDVDALRRALGLVVGRHDALRARFVVVDGTPYQVVADPGEVELEVRDLAAGDTEEQRRAAAEEALRQEGAIGFDLADGPLYRFRLYRLADDDFVFCQIYHHIVTDGWSSVLINNDLVTAYTALVQGREPVFGAAPMSYSDYVRWQRERLDPATLAEELDFWSQRLAGVPVVELPTDRSRPANPSHAGGTVRHTFAPELLTRARALAQEHGASLYMVLVAAVQAVVARLSGEEDVAVGVPMLGRVEPELEEIVGLFINMTVLRTDLSGDPTFAQLLERVTDGNMDLYEHQEVPFHLVVDKVAPVRDSSRNPLFQIGVQVLDGNNSGAALALPGVSAEVVWMPSIRSRYDLSISFLESVDQLSVGVEFSTDLFERWRVEGFVRHVENLLAAVVDDASLPLSRMPLLSADERAELLELGRGEVVPYSQNPLHVDLAAVAAATPDAVAVVCRGVELTYAEFDRRADRLARHLRSLGLRHEQVVAVVVDRDLDAYVAMLGVLKAGGAFTMLDPKHPANRLDFMITDTAAPIVITRSGFADRLPEPKGWQTVLLDTDWPAIEAHPADEPLQEWTTNESLAYILYTSGSTGNPKGVMIDHRGVAFFAEAYKRTFDFTAADRFLQLPALTFDMSQGEMWTAFAVGATVVAVAPEEGLSAEALSTLMREQRVTYAGLSPAMLSVVEAGPYPDLKYVMGGAEALPAELVTKWNLPGRRFVNLYGPTEAAIACTEYECEHIEWQSSPPIGRPEVNRQVYIVDAHQNLVPRGVPGELLIGGEPGGLARGYLNQPELTAQKFVPDPFHDGRLVYRSGDSVRWTKDGQIDFLGRIDNQVKLRGLRIELGEIESALLTHPQVRMAIVLMRPDPRGDNRLIGYYTSMTDQAPDPADLARHLGELLPDYMVPTAWVALEAFPLTAARKVDRKALPDPVDTPAGDGGDGYVAPATPTETGLAEIFAEVLGAERVGTDQSFFALGGNSLQGMRVVSRINKRFGIKINIRQLYGSATIAALAATIDGLAGA